MVFDEKNVTRWLHSMDFSCLCEWAVSRSAAYSSLVFFVPRQHLPGQRQGPVRPWACVTTHQESGYRGGGGRGGQSHIFSTFQQTRPGFANVSQSDAAVTAGALSVQPSHIWQSGDPGREDEAGAAASIFWRRIQAEPRGPGQFLTVTQLFITVTALWEGADVALFIQQYSTCTV